MEVSPTNSTASTASLTSSMSFASHISSTSSSTSSSSNNKFSIFVLHSFGPDAIAVDNLHPWTPVSAVKAALSASFGIPADKLRLFYGARELKHGQKLLHDCNVTAGSRLHVGVVVINEDTLRQVPGRRLSGRHESAPPQRDGDDGDGDDGRGVRRHGARRRRQQSAVGSGQSSIAAGQGLALYGGWPCPPGLLQHLMRARQGLAAGLAPRLSMEGTGGTYILKDAHKRPAVIFKARDEEAFAPNNPRGYVGEYGQTGLRPGIQSGEGYLREVAAFVLDHDGFCGVPMTTIVEVYHPAFNYGGDAHSLSTRNPQHGIMPHHNPLVFVSSGGGGRPKPKRTSDDTALVVGAKQSSNGSHRKAQSSRDDISLLNNHHHQQQRQQPPLQQQQQQEQQRLQHEQRNQQSSSTEQEQADYDDDGEEQEPEDSTMAANVKVGSLQEFVDYDEMAGDLAPQTFPVREVHKIGLLDIRMVNTDRNDANILVKRKRGTDVTLVPIDHSYSLPDVLEIAWTDWVWLGWPQAKVPFDEETKRWVDNLDVARDMHELRTKFNVREECLTLMRICNTLLKKGVKAGLNLYEIASILCRSDLDEPSQLEIICAQATALMKRRRGVPNKLRLQRSVSIHDFRELSVNSAGFNTTSPSATLSHITATKLNTPQHLAQPQPDADGANNKNKKKKRNKNVARLSSSAGKKRSTFTGNLSITPLNRNYSDPSSTTSSSASAASSPSSGSPRVRTVHVEQAAKGGETWSLIPITADAVTGSVHEQGVIAGKKRPRMTHADSDDLRCFFVYLERLIDRAIDRTQIIAQQRKRHSSASRSRISLRRARSNSTTMVSSPTLPLTMRAVSAVNTPANDDLMPNKRLFVRNGSLSAESADSDSSTSSPTTASPPKHMSTKRHLKLFASYDDSSSSSSSSSSGSSSSGSSSDSDGDGDSDSDSESDFGGNQRRTLLVVDRFIRAEMDAVELDVYPGAVTPQANSLVSSPANGVHHASDAEAKTDADDDDDAGDEADEEREDEDEVDPNEAVDAIGPMVFSTMSQSQQNLIKLQQELQRQQRQEQQQQQQQQQAAATVVRASKSNPATPLYPTPLVFPTRMQGGSSPPLLSLGATVQPNGGRVDGDQLTLSVKQHTKEQQQVQRYVPPAVRRRLERQQQQKQQRRQEEHDEHEEHEEGRGEEQQQKQEKNKQHGPLRNELTGLCASHDRSRQQQHQQQLTVLGTIVSANH